MASPRTHSMPARTFQAILGLCLLGSCTLATTAPCTAQSSGSKPSTALPTLTLHTGTRLVVTDVVVKDRKGNPVHSLPESDFSVYDDGKPQRISSFREHTLQSTMTSLPGPATANGAFSNAYTQHLPPVLNVLVLDTTNLELPDQMYLGLQLRRFIDMLPPEQPIAIFDRHGNTAVLLQSFTADHALLLTAVRKAVPRILLTGREYRSDTNTLSQIAGYLSQVPGRKNVLWFSGGSSFFLLAGLDYADENLPTPTSSASPNSQSVTPGEDLDSMREVYDELEADRIAVYPIDARSLSPDGDIATPMQQTQMNDIAKATGGQAFYNTNGLAGVADRILATDSSTYTVAYSPHDFKPDKTWHTVKITVKGPYTLSYRRGYFADPQHVIAPHSARKRPLILAGDTTPTAPPDPHSAPIIFQATAHPQTAASTADQFVPLRPFAPAARGTTAYAIDYTLSTAALSSANVNGKPRATVDFAVMAFDNDGYRVAQALDQVRLPLPSGHPPELLKVQQQINLRKGSTFISLIVWDAASGRLGTLQIPVQVR